MSSEKIPGYERFLSGWLGASLILFLVGAPLFHAFSNPWLLALCVPLLLFFGFVLLVCAYDFLYEAFTGRTP